MTNSVFTYQVVPLDPPSEAFPRRTTTLRPRIPLALTEEGTRFPCLALVDSGADDCLFPISFARQLGLKVPNRRRYAFGGAGGGDVQTAHFFDLQITIGNVARYRIPVGFTTALEGHNIGVLGQNGFFNHFAAAFNFRKGIFTLTR